MKNFKQQNICILIGILLLDVVVYLLMALLFMGEEVRNIVSETVLAMAMYVWHGVNLILMGYLASVSMKAHKGQGLPKVVKNNKNDILVNRSKRER